MLNMIVLAGASASGKTEAAKLLASKYGITKVITTTTRAMRNGEVNGRDYFFVDRDTFKKMIEEGRFVEYTEYNGNLYIEHSGTVYVLENGAWNKIEQDETTYNAANLIVYQNELHGA